MSSGLVVHLARFGCALRGRGVGVGLRDEADGLEALSLIDLGARAEVRRALRAALKIRPRDAAAIDELFARWWSARPPRAAGETAERPAGRADAPRRAAEKTPKRPAGRPEPPRFEDPTRPPRPGPARQPSPGSLKTAETPETPETIERGVAMGEEPGYSPEALLRRKSFEECSAADLEAMERLMDRLALRLPTPPRPPRAPGRGETRSEVDPRRSFRRALVHGGELLSLARRRRAIEVPRLVVLCDTSGSMDPHTRFLLGFVLALRRGARRSELFAFNTT